MSDEMIQQKPGKRVKVVDEVYCLDHTTVHENTVNPYGECRESWCRKSEHRKLYWTARKGDWA